MGSLLTRLYVVKLGQGRQLCFQLNSDCNLNAFKLCGMFVIGLDKEGYPVNIFLISPWKHMLLVLIRSASHTYVFME